MLVERTARTAKTVADQQKRNPSERQRSGRLYVDLQQKFEEIKGRNVIDRFFAREFRAAD